MHLFGPWRADPNQADADDLGEGAFAIAGDTQGGVSVWGFLATASNVVASLLLL